MPNQAARGATADAAAYRAIEHIYHSYLTGLILMLVSCAGAERAAEVVFRTFRRQQLARFLPGLEKLGLDQTASCGGVCAVSLPVEPGRRCESRICLRERSQGLGTVFTAALDLVRHGDLRNPSEVSRAMLRGGTPTMEWCWGIRAWASSVLVKLLMGSRVWKVITRSGS